MILNLTTLIIAYAALYALIIALDAAPSRTAPDLIETTCEKCLVSALLAVKLGTSNCLNDLLVGDVQFREVS